MRRRLFWRFYATLLASLILTGAALGLLGRVVLADAERPWPAIQRQFLDAMIPDNAAPQAELDRAVARLARGTAGKIEVLAPSGRLIARADVSASQIRSTGWAPWSRKDPRTIEVALRDGRIVRARLPGRGRPGLALLFVIVIVVGLGAWPVAAQLTRRLERMRAGVELWGAGAVSTRVPAEGRDEIAAVATAFNAAADRVERLLETHRDLLAHASHELRSPVARLRMVIELNRSALPEAVDDEIVRNLTELDELIEGILLSSRLEHDGAALRRREPVDLLALAAEEAVRVDADVDGVQVTIDGDPRLLRRLLRNLLENARKHGAPPIEVEVGWSDLGHAFIAVRDDGQGIAADERDRIFDPFYRPSKLAESKSSWGLGLTLVRQIAEHHGGSVVYQALPGRGAAFMVTLRHA